MSTLRQLIEHARHALSGYDSSKDSVGALTSALTSSGLVVGTDATDLAPGLVEIDLELLRVKAVDPATGQLQLYAFGRGYRGTTAAAHSAGAEVTFNPNWPVSTLAREINSILDVIYPRIYVVAETTVEVDTYGRLVIPDDCVGILSVFAQNTVDDQWSRPQRWQYDPHSGAGDGRTLQVNDWLTGSDYRIVYAKRPGKFDLSLGLDQEFTTVTGLEGRIETIITIGLAARLAPFIDVARLPFLAAEPRLDAQNRQDSATITRLLDSLFQRSVGAETAVLNRDHPIKAHRTVL